MAIGFEKMAAGKGFRVQVQHEGDILAGYLALQDEVSRAAVSVYAQEVGADTGV
jgi:hypothetical protein